MPHSPYSLGNLVIQNIVFYSKLQQKSICLFQPSEIARHLSLVRHGIRTRLDEIKRREIDRLVDLHHRLDKVEHPQEPGQRANVFRLVLFTCY